MYSVTRTENLRWFCRVAWFLSCLVILKVVGTVILSYRRYVPPDFQTDFLVGRESYFWQGYHWAFYVHIVSGPISLLLGIFLISSWPRRKMPLWHRRLGRVQVFNVLFAVVPSGLLMSWNSAGGVAAGSAFASLAVATGAFVALGWRAALRGDFESHRRWMSRCFVLLCSAVTLRILGGLLDTLQIDSEWAYPVSGWISWLVPLIVYELVSGSRAKFFWRSVEGRVKPARE